MKPLGYSTVDRFDPRALFHPKTVLLSGAETTLGRRLRASLAEAAFDGTIVTAIEDLPPDGAAERGAGIDLALIADPAERVPERLAALSGRLRGAAIVASDVPDLAAVAHAARVRVLGPHSFGISVPGIGLNAFPAHRVPMAGRVAFIGQSATLARAVIDWAEPNGIGFSSIIGIGGNADLGFGRVLDHLSRDPGTGLIMVEVTRIRDPRLFLSAAKAASRLRPIVALAPGARLLDPGATALAAFEAALARAGVLLTRSFGEFLAATETLNRARPARGEGLAIIGNSRGGGWLAADAALAAGIDLARLSAETRRVLSLTLGNLPPEAEPLTVADRPGTRLADLAALLAAAPEVGGVLVVMTPTGLDDATAIAGLVACARTIAAPLLVAIPGEATGAEQRRVLGEAGLAAVPTPEAAGSGFADLLKHREIRAAARELPPATVLETEPDRVTVRRTIEAAREHGRLALTQQEAFAILDAYGIGQLPHRRVDTPDGVAEAAEEIGFPVVIKLDHPSFAEGRPEGSVSVDLPDADSARAAAAVIRARLTGRGFWPQGAGFLVQRQASRAREFRIRVAERFVVGPTIGFGPGGGDLTEVGDLAVDLPPLNLALAKALIDRSPAGGHLRLGRGLPEARRESLETALVRVSQMIVDWPEIEALDIDPLFATESEAIAASARIRLRPAEQARRRLAFVPYPAELSRHLTLKGRDFEIRPIRPEDAEAHQRLFARLSPEDVRRRFFSAVRALTPEQVMRMAEVDYEREMALIAVEIATGETNGVARLVRSDTDGREAEFAVLVESAAKGLGLGSALMRALIDWGRSQGVAEIVGQVLAENTPMIAFSRALGFRIVRSAEEPDVVEARLALD